MWQSIFGSSGPGQDNEILYSRSTDGVNWSALWLRLIRMPRRTAAPTAIRILRRMVRGVWIAAWDSRNTTAGEATTALNVHFARSLINGATWSAPQGLSNSQAVTNQSPLRSTTGPSIATWTAPSDPNGDEGFGSGYCICAFQRQWGNLDQPRETARERL